MPTVPLPLRGGILGDSRRYYITSVALTGRWVVNLRDDLVNIAQLPASPVTSGAVASVLGNPLPYPKTTQFNTLATSNDNQGCTLSSGALFVIGVDPSPITNILDFGIFLSADFTYPAAWDDAAMTGQGLNGSPMTGYIASVEVEVNLTGTTGALPITKLIYLQCSFPRLDIDSFGDFEDNSYDDAAIEIENEYIGGRNTRRGGTPSLSELFPRFGLNYAPSQQALRQPQKKVVIGAAWTQPGRPTIDFFRWTWGDASEDSIVPANETVYEVFNSGIPPETLDGEMAIKFFASGQGVTHDFESESDQVFVRATDSYGRRSPKFYITANGSGSGNPIVFAGNIQFSAVHNNNNEVFVAQEETDKAKPQGVTVTRTITNLGAGSVVSFVSGASSPRLFFNAAEELFASMVLDSAYHSAYRSPDGGETWEFMTASPFDSETYTTVIPCSGMFDGLTSLIAVGKNESAIQFSLYNGASWTSPVVAGGITGKSRALAFFQEHFAGSARLRILGQGLDRCSLDQGETWDNTP